MSLYEYQRKRRPGGTPEPMGAEAPRGTRNPSFVVQLHHARARHYDFRLEVDGVLKSWAVPKGPSLRAGDRRLAVQVEDHPLEYASFEGDIPAGNYGAGKVEIFDRGSLRWANDPLLALAKGKLDFTLSGARLKGAWTLVRTRSEGKQPQWLLIKRSDEHARDLDADALLDRPAEVSAPPKRARRAPRKKRRTAAHWREIAMALPGARRLARLPIVEPHKATLSDRVPHGERWLHELKWDGYRIVAAFEGQNVRLRTSSGLDWTDRFPAIAEAVAELDVDLSCFDGELIALDADGRDDFGHLQSSLKKGEHESLRYVLFDVPILAGIDLRHAPLASRKRLLEDLQEDAPERLIYSRHIVGNGAEMLEQSRRFGQEGIVSKRVDSRYFSGRSRAWLKIKHRLTDEFVVVGYTRPKGARSGFGSLLLAARGAGSLRYAGRVGTGFDDALLRSIAARLQALATRAAPVELPAHVPFRIQDITWVDPRMIVEVAYRGLGSEGLLRQASFVRIREDKKMSSIGDTVDKSISSPEKVVYPELGLSKRDVARYYAAVAHLLLPEIERRPLSLVRCPDGVDKACFFQRHHANTLGENVRSVLISERDGDQENYVVVDTTQGIMDLVQMNAIEFHPWGSRFDSLERPDTLVFDLDPGDGVAWRQVVDAAKEVRDKLAEIGLTSFARVSGGKGIHVVAPIEPTVEWDEAKGFCEGFARAMTAFAPQRYIATAAKSKRSNRIFIDWLRNGRSATSIASWSLRARQSGSVAMPVRWAELAKIPSASHFDLRRALRRAQALRSSPWRDWETALTQTLPAGL